MHSPVPSVSVSVSEGPLFSSEEEDVLSFAVVADESSAELEDETVVAVVEPSEELEDGSFVVESVEIPDDESILVPDSEAVEVLAVELPEFEVVDVGLSWGFIPAVVVSLSLVLSVSMLLNGVSTKQACNTNGPETKKKKEEVDLQTNKRAICIDDYHRFEVLVEAA